ncbi:FAD-binding oxidoreductase [Alicyclobacillus sp. TC]|uniref:FAD-binding oxidoreductase n=1 Tax=Alicyclobacillus sp. TC TaxID=2606450 RepID=UPI00193350E6|nr:FAD-binding oxidoreductase [Alicyclobacillus sp. TC]QRF22793.1 FAD-binding oxidoreductase [Alicyclobacillus sp. TC]
MLGKNFITVEEMSRDKLESMISGEVLFPEHVQYNERRKVWNGLFDKRPAVIVNCQNEKDVMTTVRFARSQKLAVAVRGGTHHIAGYGTCEGGVLIDTSAMREVKVDLASQTVKVQSGAQAGDVIRETQKYGLAVPTGDVSKVGIAGLTLGGGMGYLRRKYGLTCDHLLEAEIVLADGHLIRVNEVENSELFFAIRGGGGNFGIATSFTFQARPIGPMVYGIHLMYSIVDLTKILQVCRNYLREGHHDVSFNIAIHTIPPLPHVPDFLIGKKIVSLSGMHASEDMEYAAREIAPLRSIAEPLLDLCGPVNYTHLHTQLDERIPVGIPAYGKSIYLRSIDDISISTITNALDKAGPTSMGMVWILGGRMAEIPAHETAFGQRDAEALVIMESLAVPGISTMEEGKGWVDEFHQKLSCQQPSLATYLNMAGLEHDPQKVVRASYGHNYERLSAVKRQYDPENIFCFNPNILPD